MSYAEIRIGDVNAAMSAFGALTKLSGMAKFSVDQAEFSARLSRMSGRARPLAVALNRYVETHGFDDFRTALGKERGQVRASGDALQIDAEAAATASNMNFDELDRTAMTFAASGLY